MLQIFSKTLPTSDADLDVQSMDFDDPESLNLELAEKVIQRKLRTILDELGDITRMTICLAERQSNRYKKAVKETLNKDEHCFLHARVKTSNQTQIFLHSQCSNSFTVCSFPYCGKFRNIYYGKSRYGKLRYGKSI